MKSIIKFLSTILFCVSVNSHAIQPKISKISKVTANFPRTQARLVIDGSTGQVLYKYNIDHKIYPASLTKLMTLYLTFEALAKKQLSLHQKLSVPLTAEKMAPCKLGLTTRDTITVQDAVMALIVKSANDAAVVLAHALSTSEPQFAKKMTTKAKALGMRNTVFHNASGWHNPKQYSTARDLAKLAMALYRDFPQYYTYFANNDFKFAGKVIRGHNYVTANYKGAEGLKTGYTSASGYNLISTASRDGRRIVGIIIGENNARTRDDRMMALLDQYFPLTSIMPSHPKVLAGSRKKTTISKPKQPTYAKTAPNTTKQDVFASLNRTTKNPTTMTKKNKASAKKAAQAS